AQHAARWLRRLVLTDLGLYFKPLQNVPRSIYDCDRDLGQAAIKQALGHTFDPAVLDLSLPNKDELSAIIIERRRLEHALLDRR
ncbi:MAG: hypothetical protein AAFW75_31175, partial [Cyanobacteria bacterium J06636_16]